VSAPKLKVLFVCVGNACRSQMAEAFARVNGNAALEAASAGLAPAVAIPADTHMVMREKGIGLNGHSPKPLAATDGDRFDLIVNLSGAPLPSAWSAKVREWKVPDPIGLSLKFHREVRDQIEALVQGLILQTREIAAPLQAAPPQPAAPQPAPTPGGQVRHRTRPRLLRG
jgi:protein-tyrosine-phosphatase